MKKEKTILTFITSIRHPDNSNDYNGVWNLLRNTLRSICAQTNENFKVIVVANKILDDFKSDPQIKNLEFVEVDFKAPAEKGKVHTTMESLRHDRSTKYVRGLIHAKKYNSIYTMFVDADDFLSNKLVQYIADNDKDQNGWTIKDGFVSDLKKIKPKSDPKSFCGSNIIINTKLLESEINFSILNNSSTQNEITKSSSKFYLSRIIGSHKFSVDYFGEKKLPFTTIPFPGTIYHVDTGENHSLAHFRTDLENGAHAIPKNIIKEFNLPL